MVHSPGGWKSKMKAPAGRGVGFPDSWPAPSYWDLTRRASERALWGLSSKVTNPNSRLHTHDLITPRAPLQTPPLWGQGFSTGILREHEREDRSRWSLTTVAPGAGVSRTDFVRMQKHCCSESGVTWSFGGTARDFIGLSLDVENDHVENFQNQLILKYHQLLRIGISTPFPFT